MHTKRFSDVGRVSEAAWREIEPPDFPFFDFAFLRALERSGSVGGASGWEPVYLLCKDGDHLLGALPSTSRRIVTASTSSTGSGRTPTASTGSPTTKLVAAVPFTPATGPKLLLRHDEAERAAVTAPC